MEGNDVPLGDRLRRLKRLCYVVMRFPVVSETFIVEEAQSLRKFGVDCHVLALEQGDYSLIHANAKDIITDNAVSYLEDHSKLKTLIALASLIARRPFGSVKTLRKALTHPLRWRYFQLLPYAVKLLEKKIDYIHAHFADQNLRTAALLSEWTAIPFGFTAHRYDIINDPLPIRDFRELSAKASAIVTVSEHNKHLIVKKYGVAPNDIYVAYNGIRTEIFQPGQKKINEGPLRLINVGRLTDVKGQDILLSALFRVRELGHTTRLRLVGEGPNREALVALARRLDVADDVEFLGAQSQDAVRRYLGEADVFVMPSRSEGFAVACLEAMAMELPVIVSNVAGFPEAIGNQESGIITELENIEQLAHAIVWMIEHPGRREAMGRKGREKVLARFTRDKVSANLIEYWDKAISM